MAWNWLDIAVLLLALGQIALVITIGVVAGRIRRGSVARVGAMAGRTIATAKTLATTATTIGGATLPHLAGIRAALTRLPRSFRPVRLSEAPVSYRSLLQNAGMVQSLRGVARNARGGNRVRPLPRAGFAERAGLVPPVWKKIAPLWGYAATALSVWKEVEAQLPQIRRATRERVRAATEDTNPVA